MTYCPYTGQVVVNTAGIVSAIKLLSLKHKVPCNLSVVLDTYTENPRKWFVKVFEEPVLEKMKFSLLINEKYGILKY